MSPPISRLILLALSLASCAGEAGVYKCLDANNKIFYQDKPCKELTSAGLSPALAKLAPAESQPVLFWKLTQGDRMVYLLGSLNYGTADMYPLPEAIMDAFAASKVLVVAKELDAGSDVSGPVATKGSYADGSTLSTHIKPLTWQKTLELAKTYNITEETLNPLRPWMAALLLKNAALKQAGLDEKLSVDKAFVKAGETLKPILELDPVDERIKFYEALSAAEQEQVLVRALYEADPKNDYFKFLVDAWKRGDADAIEEAAGHAAETSLRSGKALDEKDEAKSEAMANKIAEMAADGRPYFIIMDTRRLPGSKGIIALLKAKGFQASQL